MSKGITYEHCFLLLLLCVLSVNGKDLEYYKKLIGNGDKVEAIAEEGGIVLSAKENIEVYTRFMSVRKEHVISGCGFYPHKEEIVKLIHKFTADDPIFIRQMFQKVFTFVYQLLYYKNADKRKIRNQFRDRYFNSSPYFKFELGKEQEEFFATIEARNEKFSFNSFSFTEDEMNLARKLNFDVFIHDQTNKLFDFVAKSINHMPQGQTRANLKSFALDKRNFIKYFDYINKDYLLLEKGNINENEFQSHQQSLMQYDHPNDSCFLIGPLFDLIDNSLHVGKPGQPITTGIKEGKEIEFLLQKNIPAGTKLVKELDDRLSEEKLLLDFGILNEGKSANEHNSIVANVNFDFDQLGETKMSICAQGLCLGIDLSLFSERRRSVQHKVTLGKEINYQLLNVAKLFVLPKDKFDLEFVMRAFAHNWSFKPSVELPAMTQYLEFISQSGPKEITFKEVFENKNNPHPTKVIVKLWSIGLENIRITLLQQKFILEKMSGMLLNEIQKKFYTIAHEKV